MLKSSPPSPDNVIEIQGVTRRFGAKRALDNVSFAVPRGIVFGLVGANGAGRARLAQGLPLYVTVIAPFFAMLVLANGGKDVATTWKFLALVVLMPAGLAAMIGIEYGRASFPFVATRPASTATLVRSKFEMALVSALAAYIPVLLLVPFFFLQPGFLDPALQAGAVGWGAQSCDDPAVGGGPSRAADVERTPREPLDGPRRPPLAEQRDGLRRRSGDRRGDTVRAVGLVPPGLPSPALVADWVARRALARRQAARRELGGVCTGLSLIAVWLIPGELCQLAARSPRWCSWSPFRDWPARRWRWSGTGTGNNSHSDCSETLGPD